MYRGSLDILQVLNGWLSCVCPYFPAKDFESNSLLSHVVRYLRRALYIQYYFSRYFRTFFKFIKDL